MRILAVGIATLDIVNVVAAYPAEDDEVRAIGQWRSRGGNATNSLVVLSQIGHETAWGGCLSDDDNSELVRREMQRHQIDCSQVCIQPNATLPTSYITLSEANGSRTIVHYRQLDEYRFDDFEKIDVESYDWIHFEGRNVEELELMMRYLRQKGLSNFSLEVEKHRDGIEELFDLPGMLLFSRAYVSDKHNAGVRAFFDILRERQIQVPVFCAWGKLGGWAMDERGKPYQQPAWQPKQVVDTLGAGDVFNAAIIDAHLRGLSVEASLEFGCYLAGYKCGIQGFDGLAEALQA
ncbi:MAG: PfkB family carbohydrate kinase [Chromatiales bacterium]|jgi:ketohexokinase